MKDFPEANFPIHFTIYCDSKICKIKYTQIYMKNTAL